MKKSLNFVPDFSLCKSNFKKKNQTFLIQLAENPVVEYQEAKGWGHTQYDLIVVGSDLRMPVPVILGIIDPAYDWEEFMVKEKVIAFLEKKGVRVERITYRS